MASASQMLTTTILINAKQNGLTALGDQFIYLGSQIDKVSRRLINFGKEAANVYMDYEESMKEASNALSTKLGMGTDELQDAMEQLDKSARKWASETIFHTDDVANAINVAAHASWDLNTIFTVMPKAMQLAQAGSIDLEEAIDYLTIAMNAYGVEVDNVDTFIDQWVYAANSSRGTVESFGTTMQKMGATMRFTGSQEELLALIGLLQTMGETGETAATLLRTSMLRILAPSGTADEVLKNMANWFADENGVLPEAIEDELNDSLKKIRVDSSVSAAMGLLAEQGFSAFDEHGQAKDILTIYTDLGAILAQMAGGWENISKNKTTLGIINTIFGMRGLRGATDIINGLETAVTLRDELLNGNAEGYGEYMQEEMMDTLYGSTELLASKWENLELVVGEALSGKLRDAYDYLGGLIDKVAGFDDSKWSALIGGFEVIAGAGFGLMSTGLVLKGLGTIFGSVGAAGVIAALGLISVKNAADSLAEYNFQNAFGDMDLDTTAFDTYISTITSGFQSAYDSTHEYIDALVEARKNYRITSAQLSSKLLTKAITGAQLTEDDKVQLIALGAEMDKYLTEGITARYNQSQSYWTTLFADSPYTVELGTILDLNNSAYTQMLQEAAGLGQQMRAAMNDAFFDGEVTEDEYQQILNYIKAYNEAIARATAEAKNKEEYVTMQNWLRMGQSASMESMQEIAEQAASERDQILADRADLYYQNLYGLQYDFEQLQESEEWANMNSVQRASAKAKYRLAQAAAEKEFNEGQAEVTDAYNDFLVTFWENTLLGGVHEGEFQNIGAIAQSWMSGERSEVDAISMITSMYGRSLYAGTGNDKDSTTAILGRALGIAIQSMGGEEAVAQQIADYSEAGNSDLAERLRNMLAMEQLLLSFGTVTSEGSMPKVWEALSSVGFEGFNFRVTGQTGFAPEGQNLANARDWMDVTDIMSKRKEEKRESWWEGRDKFGGLLDVPTSSADIQAAAQDMGIQAALDSIPDVLTNAANDTMKIAGTGIVSMSDAFSQRVDSIIDEAITPEVDAFVDNAINNALNRRTETNLGESSGAGRYSGRAGTGRYSGSEEGAIRYSSEAAGASFNELIEAVIQQGLEAQQKYQSSTEEPGTGGFVGFVESFSQKIDDAIDSAITPEVDAFVENAINNALTIPVDGDTTQLEADINALDSKTINITVDGDTSNLSAKIESLRRAGTGKRVMVPYAEGGRATTASIFGEAGPEWAIPEEHSRRTAELLDAARRASGFTWPDLLATYGGLNANPNARPTTVVYSPTINAGSTEGLDTILREDKRRLELWWEERAVREELEVY